MLLRELEDYENSANQRQKKENYVNDKMFKFMESYYDKLKNEIGIDANYGVEREDAQLEQVLKTLKPNTTAKNFKEFLRQPQNVNKNEKWKAIARKTHKQEEQEKKKNQGKDEGATTNFFSTRNRGENTGPNQVVGSLLNALEMVNKEAHAKGIAGGLQGP